VPYAATLLCALGLQPPSWANGITEPKIDRVLTAMLFDDERSLAWALVEATTPHLSTAQRNDLHVAIGVGETFAAIHYLITSAADNRITLAAELVHRCTRWLDAYAGHEDECYLRGRVEYVLAQQTVGVRCLESERGTRCCRPLFVADVGCQQDPST
jgi:hypothetical protein